MSTLAIIPARGGSRRLPGKNLRLLGDRPLIAWTIDAALQSRAITRTVVTTDDEAIAECARACGAEVPVMRPADLAADDTPGMLPILHMLEWLRDHEGYQPDMIVVLQPTSPLRTAADIAAALELMRREQATCLASVTPVAAASWLRAIGPGRRLARPLPGDGPLYLLNGAIYAARAGVVHAAREMDDGSAVAYVMPPERSVDIDDADDFRLAECLISTRP